MANSDTALPPISSSTHRIGWIGTGVMGSSMCANLMRGGFPATVYNRTRAKAECSVPRRHAGPIRRAP